MSRGFPREFVDEVMMASDIVAVASRYMPLRARGRLHWANCPFHHEKTPSFAIYEDRQIYKCFGCGEYGGVISLVKQLESVDFVESVELLAKWANLTIPSAKLDPEYIIKRKKRERILACLDGAREFYCQNLYLERNKSALEYLHKRGITDDLIKTFNIGVSDSWDSVISHLKKKGFSEPELMESGVCAKSEKGGIYDAMGQRITFAIFDKLGSCIGFTGRTLSEDKSVAKYRNTAQTAVFDKSSIVYGIDVLKKAKISVAMSSLIIVEGNVDVISLVGAGFANTLACMGTAMTSFHARLFKELKPNSIYLCFDGDDAGQKATLRNVDILVAGGLTVRVVTLPKDVDPDSYVTQNGAEAFQSLLNDAKPYIDFKLDYLEGVSNLDDNLGRAEYFRRAVVILSPLRDKAEVELYIPKVSKLSGISFDGVKRELQSFISNNSQTGELGNNFRGTRTEEANFAPDELAQVGTHRGEHRERESLEKIRVLAPERIVIAGILHGIDETFENSPTNFKFRHGQYQHLYDIICGFKQDNKKWHAGYIDNYLVGDDDAIKLVREIMDIPIEEVKMKWESCVLKMRKAQLEEERDEWQKKFNQSVEQSERLRASQEVNRLSKEIKSLR